MNVIDVSNVDRAANLRARRLLQGIDKYITDDEAAVWLNAFRMAARALHDYIIDRGTGQEMVDLDLVKAKLAKGTDEYS